MVSPIVVLAACGIYALAFMARARLRNTHEEAAHAQVIWELVALPLALTLPIFSVRAALFLLAILVAGTFLRPAPLHKFNVQWGPLVLVLLSSAIVYSRSAPFYLIATFTLVGILIARLLRNVDGRAIMTSLIDGCGLYVVANVLFYEFGLRSPAAASRIGSLIQSTGFVRTIYPFTTSLSTPPIIAAFYITTAIVSFLLLERGWKRRTLRLLSVMSAIIVLIGSGNRAPLAIAVVASLLIIMLPSSIRGIAQVSTLLSAVSAFVLPQLMTTVGFAIAPLMSLAPGRDSTSGSISSLEGRDGIWKDSITYWNEHVEDFSNVLFGFGVDGQYHSGASRVYAPRLFGLTTQPEFATMHNSFLQQLFDGGAVGWISLASAAFWASKRLSQRTHTWSNLGAAAVTGFAVLLLCALTEAWLSPGPNQQPFWLLFIMIGVACQVSERSKNCNRQAGDSPGMQDPAAHKAAEAGFRRSAVPTRRHTSEVDADP